MMFTKYANENTGMQFHEGRLTFVNVIAQNTNGSRFYETLCIHFCAERIRPVNRTSRIPASNTTSALLLSVIYQMHRNDIMLRYEMEVMACFVPQYYESGSKDLVSGHQIIVTQRPTAL